MSAHVAFLRGMNLGKRRVKNEELCECFEGLGLEGVSAFLASGNVIFTAKGKSAAKLEPLIEKGLKAFFAYEVVTFVRSAKEVGAIAAHRPFSAAQLAKTTKNVQVAMLKAPPSPAQRKAALGLVPANNQLAFDGRELYWLPPGNMSDSEMDLNQLSKALGVMTLRAQRTLLRLTAKLSA